MSNSPFTAPSPDPDILTPSRWSIFAAIADTVIPSFTDSSPNPILQHPLPASTFAGAAQQIARVADVPEKNDLARRYLRESATAQPEFQDCVRQLLSAYIDDATRQKLVMVLDLLSTRPGSLLLTGHRTPLDALPVSTREHILQGWAASRLFPLRDIHNSFTGIIKLFWLRTSPTIGHVLDYPSTPTARVPSDAHFPFEFIQFDAATPTETIETDVVIVGSGCGGAVAAKTLAEAGLRVLVVDKSYFWAPEHLPMSEIDAAARLFDNGGLIQSDDGKMNVIAGSTWGGGGTINWSASLHTQGYVRREWAQKFGLPFFASAQFQADLDAVCDRMGVGTAAIEHNPTNAVLVDGARQLGWSAKAVPQNTAGHSHSDGYCTLGCWSGAKQGPTTTFLPDAARAGAKFLEGFEVTEILFEDNSRWSTSKVTKGVRGIWTSRDRSGGVDGTDRVQKEVVIKAGRVISSAGTLRTPLLLKRSGLTNWHIGRHLHLHPVSFVGATWDDDIKPWEGSILTSVVNEVENLDGDGYGAKLEAMTMLPGWFLTSFPWRSGLEWKRFAANMKRMTGYISLARDRYGGHVYPDPTDPLRCRVQYSPSTHDRTHILAGIVALAQIVYVAGAREIHTTVPDFPPFIRSEQASTSASSPPSVTDPAFATWLAALRAKGLTSSDAAFASAHQMGSCRMGTASHNSVVDPRGRVWGTTGLVVCDASVFPSASGVNPMVTVMGIARGIARGLVEELGGKARL